jgi:arylsulfatase A-like enzyme
MNPEWRKSVWLGAAYGATTWGAYAVCETAFFTLRPLVVRYADIVTATHWKFTALLWLLYAGAGLMAGAAGGWWVAARGARRVAESAWYQRAASLSLLLAAVASGIWAVSEGADRRHGIALGVALALLVAVAIALKRPGAGSWTALVGPWPASMLLLGTPFLVGSSSWKLWAAFCVAVVAAAAFSRIVLDPQPGAARPPLRHALALALAAPIVVGAVLASARELPLPPSRPSAGTASQSNIVLVVMDTVRADHMSVYGYARQTTPWLKELAREATLYRRAMAPANFTLPSHASIFTGLYARSHGAIWFPPRSSNALPLDGKFETLAEILRRQGYRTFAAVANAVFLRRDYGITQGFELFDVREPAPCVPLSARHGLRPAVRRALAALAPTYRLDERLRDAAAITGDAIALAQASAGAPFFLFLNYMDAHEPYAPPPPFDTLFSGKRSRLTYRDYVRMTNEVVGGRRAIREEEREQFVARYDGGIAYIDQELRRLADFLKARGLWENTIFVVTSDHGESFGEHHFVGHAQSLYQPELHVPLLIRYPGQRAPRVVDTLVSLVDLMPTILEAAGIAVPAGLHGRSLLEPEQLDGRTVFAEAYTDSELAKLRPRHPDSQYAVFEGGFKLIYSAGGAEELYDLASDPQEERNLAGANGAASQALRRRLHQWIESVPLQVKLPKQADPKALERLRNLGYIR